MSDSLKTLVNLAKFLCTLLKEKVPLTLMKFVYVWGGSSFFFSAGVFFSWREMRHEVGGRLFKFLFVFFSFPILALCLIPWKPGVSGRISVINEKYFSYALV